MNDEHHIDPEALADEVARYLAAIETFRACDCEPTWRPEHAASAVDTSPQPRVAPIETSAR